MVRERIFLLVGSALMLAAVGGCVNRPPVLTCTPERTTLKEGDRIEVKAEATDPERDRLTYTWRSSGGKLDVHNGTATFDTTGLGAGTYSVDLTVKDIMKRGTQNTVTCSMEVEVAKNKKAPQVACEPAQATVIKGETKQLQAKGSDPNQDALTYAWTVDGKSVANTASSLEFGATGRTLGAHAVGVTVTDVDGMTANCSFAVTIARRSNVSPTVALSLDKSDVYAGETVKAMAEGQDPHDDPLTYSWTVGGSPISATGAKVEIATAGLAGGRHSVAVTVRDDRGATGTDTKSFSVRDKIVLRMSGMRLDNVAKAILDEIALKMQQNPALRATLTGHTDDRGSEGNNEKVGLKRAQAAQGYLVKEQQIEEGRLATASAGESQPVADNQTDEGREENRRVEIELFVP